MKRPLRRRAVPFACASVVFALCACIVFAQQPLQPAPTDAAPQNEPAAAPPMFRPMVPGLLVRTVYTTRDRLEVQLWDLMVGPGQSCDPVTLPGASVLEVRSGSGNLESEGKRTELKLGTTLSLPAQASFRLRNASGEQSLVLRAVIILNKTG
jgi:hypothetical protein